MVSAPFALHPKSPITSWEQLIAVENDYERIAAGTTSVRDEWAFRGQNTLAFPATSLERHCNNIGLTGEKVLDLEVKLIRDFARRYHLYGGSTPPPKGNTLEWLALLQHHGTPTRLTDFTYSFFIAAYFAVENADEDSTIWAVNTSLEFVR